MSFEDHARQLTILQARMRRMESMMQQLLTILATSHDSVGQSTQLQRLQQELAPSPQQSPQLQAIRDAMMAGDKLKAIKLYRELYGVDLKTAQDALNSM
jgi:ribosomal protein L7/L12